MLCFPLCLLYFRAPFRQQTDSAVERNTEGLSASTPLGVITNRAACGSAYGTASAAAASTTGKDCSAEEARERRRSVGSAGAFGSCSVVTAGVAVLVGVAELFLRCCVRPWAAGPALSSTASSEPEGCIYLGLCLLVLSVCLSLFLH